MSMQQRIRSPPWQLVQGDPFNLTLGGILMACLAAAKQIPGLPGFVQFHLNTYTVWNLLFILTRVLLRQQQWDPFLLCNSIGVLVGFRTAMVHGIDNNVIDKLRALGDPILHCRSRFVVADQLAHTLPALVLLVRQVRAGKSVPRANSAAAIMFGTWFTFRQGGKLDASDIYCPHPWRAAWSAIVLSSSATPPLVDALMKDDYRSAILCSFIMGFPWLVSRLNKDLKKQCDFEYALQKARAQQTEERRSSSRQGSPTKEEDSNSPVRRISSAFN
eukprot:gnl/TRDRNA2_/TRDRNA2_167429_c0_seq1.p1 gnl/TRDRNA2_/TRDRNA2_167429_c0~~gnl/TRDRNA2_/TRDRNA2_167429_c0_seq1.p1  ORF type:complete len:274 (+),score=13.80 gnl/TRDRNA2_/TRDRNA2_167429_c0_seq1:74-895(+)